MFGDKESTRGEASLLGMETTLGEARLLGMEMTRTKVRLLGTGPTTLGDARSNGDGFERLVCNSCQISLLRYR